MRLPAASFIAPFALAVLLVSVPASARAGRKAPRKAAPKTAAAQLPPDAVQAPAWILMDPETGRVLETKNPHKRMFPASTTKTMTALVAIESGLLDKVVTIGANPPKTGEQSLSLLQGERFLLRDLVRGAMIKSANDACVAIAEGVAGDLPSFIKLMNAKAKELGAKDTNFCNPHGLHDPNHYSTAYDLALISRAAMQYPEFNEMVNTERTSVHGNYKIGPVRPLLNRNRLLFRWAACDGIKTGYTKQAGRCLIASATQIDPTTQKPWRLLSVVLHAPDTWHDSRALLQYRGFERHQPFLAARADDEIAVAQARDGATQVEAVLLHDALLTLRTGEKSVLTHRTELLPLVAPVLAGQRIGTLDYYAGGQKVAMLPLVARNEVPVSTLASVLPGAPLNEWKLPALSHFATLRWAGPLVLLLGTMLLWGGLKQSNEKRQKPARRRSSNGPSSGAKNGPRAAIDKYEGAPRNSASRPNAPGTPTRRSSGYDPRRQPPGTPNPIAADSPRRGPSARSLQPTSRPALDSEAGTARWQAASEYQPTDRDEESLGEEFVARFLAEETENCDLHSLER